MSKQFYAALAYLLVPLGGMSTDIYLPSLPHMTEAFNSTDAAIQLTITSYVMAMGLAQFLAGPVSDAFGRKRLIVSSLLMQLAAITVILFASNVSMIIMMRFFQGLGAAFMIVPARALLNDCFSGEELKKKFNYLTICFALAPIVAPFIGGYCQDFFGWQASFIVLVLYNLMLLVLVLGFSEETMKQQRPFSVKDLIGNYVHIVKERSYIYPTLLVSVMFGYMSLINVLGPFIFQNKLGLTPVGYGYIALLFGLAWFLGNVVNQIFFNSDKHIKVIASMLCQTIVLVIMYVLAHLNVMTVFTTTATIFLLIFNAAVIFPIFVGECLAQFPKLAASCNAFLFASTWLAFALYTLIATLIPVETLMPLTLVYAVVNIISYGLYLLTRRHPPLNE